MANKNMEEDKKAIKATGDDEEYLKSENLKPILNTTVMESLVDKGLVSIAKAFSAESGTSCEVEDTESKEKIKNLIMEKRFDDAIRCFQELGMDSISHPNLFFGLERLKYLELIDQQKLVEAMSFSEKFSRWEKHPEFNTAWRKTFLHLLDDPKPDKSLSACVLRDTEIKNLAELASRELNLHYKHHTDALLDKAKIYLETHEDASDNGKDLEISGLN